ncbi:MAG: thioredoxin [Bacteroidota bacterium]|jgi:thioredoxin 1|nr:thioredoxin [Bacteroidales bacterium]MDI9534852.1 thioredoxin [Bacteroidota bacterium]OQC45240.1 MAG: Thioredoxin [Bacteroidetes bacterium ADurb.Bin028]NLP20394.1 thioredoxin [Bacteroidales bacterium]HNY44003.1 thioredoxin [Bacteroidales bacterium]
MKNLVLFFASIFLLGIFTFSELNAQEAKSNIKELTESNFNTSIKKGLVLVDFYADWCRPCKMMQPILEDVATEYNSQITITKINIDNNKNISSKYNVTGIPCMILFENGKEVKRVVGYHEKEQLLEKLADKVKMQ